MSCKPIAFCPEGKAVVVVGEHNSIRVKSLSRISSVCSNIQTRKGVIRISQDSRLPVNSSGPKRKFWQSVNHFLYELLRESSFSFVLDTKGNLDGTLRVICLAISPNGDRLAIGGYWVPKDPEIHQAHGVVIWDGKEGLLLGQHPEDMQCLAFHPEGRFLASGGRDGVRMWDTLTSSDNASVEEHNTNTDRVYSSGELEDVSSLCFARKGDAYELVVGYFGNQLQTSYDGKWIWGFHNGEISLQTFEEGKLQRIASWLAPHVQALHPLKGERPGAKVAWVDDKGMPHVREIELVIPKPLG